MHGFEFTKKPPGIKIRLTEKQLERFEKLKNDTGADDEGEVVRQALKLYEYCVREHLAGKKFFVQGGNGEFKEIIELVQVT